MQQVVVVNKTVLHKFPVIEESIFAARPIAANRTSISIVDTGLGIPPESISYLFQRFYRAKNVTVAEIPGNSIGLYIVKSIIEELGGKSMLRVFKIKVQHL
jgi:signal transduction histidine kinase